MVRKFASDKLKSIPEYQANHLAIIIDITTLQADYLINRDTDNTKNNLSYMIKALKSTLSKLSLD